MTRALCMLGVLIWNCLAVFGQNNANSLLPSMDTTAMRASYMQAAEPERKIGTPFREDEAGMIRIASRAAMATVKGFEHLKNLDFSPVVSKLQKIINLNDESAVYPFPITSSIHWPTTREWQSFMEEIDRLRQDQRNILTTLLDSILHACAREAKMAAMTHAPHTNHLYSEHRAWTEILSAARYVAPRRQRSERQSSNSLPTYIGSTTVSDLSLHVTARYLEFPSTPPETAITTGRSSKLPTGSKRLNGLYVHPMFKLENVPCYGVDVDVKMVLEIPPNLIYRLKKKKIVHVEKIALPGGFAMVDRADSIATAFLTAGSVQELAIYFSDDEITLPAGTYPLNISFQVFINEVPAAKSAAFSFRYSKQ